MSRIETPEWWKGAIDSETVEVLPLVTDSNRNYDNGWCTYVYEHAQAPDLEVLCGGVNSKTPQAGAVWRQGDLLHFGFEQSPAQMNEAGRGLLVNAIAYISRFTEDRAIIRAPSPRIFDRGAISRLAGNPSRELSMLKYYASEALYEELQDHARDELSAWYREHEPWLHADATGRLALDEEARSFGPGPATAEFLAQAIQALRDGGDRGELARQLLDRYAPDGPVRREHAEGWGAWYAGNRPYLFFSDTGGYQWYVDPLAKSRQVPTADLHGVARATRPPLVKND